MHRHAMSWQGLLRVKQTIKSGLVIISEMYSGSLLVYHCLLCCARPFAANSRAFVKDIMKNVWETGQIENEISVNLLIYDFPAYTLCHKVAAQARALDKA